MKLKDMTIPPAWIIHQGAGMLRLLSFNFLKFRKLSINFYRMHHSWCLPIVVLH